MKNMKRIILTVAVFLSFITLNAAPQIYVDVDAVGADDGSSWADAYQDLQSALEDADASIKPIWIAKGTYIPSQTYTVGGELGGKFGQDVRDGGGSLSADELNSLKTFNLPDNAILYGGFISGDDDLSDADPEANPTILSGDLNGDDVRKDPFCGGSNEDPCPAGDLYTPESKVDNVWHVVTLGDDVSNFPNAPIPMTANLNGLTISGGYARGPNNFNIGGFLHGYGSGIYAKGAHDLTVSNIAIKNNKNRRHGTVFVGSYILDQDIGFHSGNLTISDSTFIHNDRSGIFARSISGVSVLRSEFISNRGLGGAGMLVLVTDSITIGDETHFSGGYTDRHGSGVRIVSSGDITIDETHFLGGFAGRSGSGVSIFSSGVVTIDSSTFKDGYSLDDGAIDVGNNESVIIRNSLFEDNIADGPYGSGGAIHSLYNESLLVENSSFFRNEAVVTGTGGAINAIGPDELSSTFIIRDNYFEGNIARGEYGDEGAGGAVIVQWGLSLDMYRNTFYNNDASDGGAFFGLVIADANIYENIFDMNSATSGGGIFNFMVNNSTINDNEFTYNSATEIGGAIVSLLGDSIKMSKNHLKYNSAGVDGGAIFALDTYFESNKDHFNFNTAGGDGGALSLIEVDGDLLKSHFNHNDADGLGDSIFLYDSTVNLNKPAISQEDKDDVIVLSE